MLLDATDPHDLFAAWYAEAEASEPRVPDAVQVATVADGLPEVRTVLLKAFGPEGWWFYTNLGSPKALQLAASNGVESGHASWDGSYTLTTRTAAARAYAEAGIDDPREEIDLLEVHDCFSITELIVMEDLGLSEPGDAPGDILDGKYDRDGKMPCQIDGGLKCFGHPIGASGLRMAYEIYLQLLGRAGDRQLESPSIGMTHNLGGIPIRNIASVSVFGLTQ